MDDIPFSVIDSAIEAADTCSVVSAYDSSLQPSKLEVIEEHQILETPLLSPLTSSAAQGLTESNLSAYFAQGKPQMMIALTNEATSPITDQSLSSVGTSVLPTSTEPTLPNNHSDLESCSAIHQVEKVDSRLFGSPTALTPSDSSQSLELGLFKQSTFAPRFSFQRRAVSTHSSFASDLCTAALPGQSLLLTKGQLSFCGSRPRVEGIRDEFVSRSRRYLTKGSAGFLRVQGTSAISLRPRETSNDGLTSPCDECPNCRRLSKSGEAFGVPFGRGCPCRICTIISDGAKGAPTLLKLHKTTKKTSMAVGGISRVPSEVGIFCEHCNQSGFILPDGRCSRFIAHSHSVQAAITVDGIVGTSEESECIVGGARKSSREMGGRSTSNLTAVVSSRSQLSLSSVLTSNEPLCRICHSTSDTTDSLMSPCRCSGSLKFVHLSCLVHWLDISSRKLRRPAICELCHYRYRRHKALKWNTMKWPSCRRNDKLFHLLFVLAVMIMLACAVATVVCFQFEKKYGRYAKERSQNNVANVTHPLHAPVEVDEEKQVNRIIEVVTLVAGVMFFVGFFVAMYAEVKAHVTIYKYLRRYWAMNHEWVIDEYRPAKDLEYVRQLTELRRKNRPKAEEEPIILRSSSSAASFDEEEAADEDTELPMTPPERKRSRLSTTNGGYPNAEYSRL